MQNTAPPGEIPDGAYLVTVHSYELIFISPNRWME